ncbi:MAG TPA: Panacea domain-containing protein [Gallionellaceae bacterium]|nr:Panacea domain-containing protein [Gallionellaceae bacterium]
MFNERKVAQMAAFLLRKQNDRMPHLKLMKLLYLADRESMGRFGAPISGDRIVAMPHGPVLSMTLNLMDGDVESSPGGWDGLISDKENHELSLKHAITRDDLDELSQADIDVLEAVWAQFGHMDKWTIRDYTHDHCPEWTDPNGSSNPIPYESVFRALGQPADVAMELSARIESERTLDKIFATL